MSKEPGRIPCHRSFEGWANELCPTIWLPVAVQEETRGLADPWVVPVPLEPLLVDYPQTFFLVGPQGRLLQQGVEDTTKDPAGHPLQSTMCMTSRKHSNLVALGWARSGCKGCLHLAR